MDRIINTKTDKQTIYEIYRACRLCGGGAGYKMPIVQTVIDLDNHGVELKQKILECLQIEVHQDDKMPPLICELCVDKVNDFYDFMEMCKQINKRTRMRLGLPAQTFVRSAASNASSDSGDCILGVTEPVYIQDDDENVPLSKSIKVKKKDPSSNKNEKIGKVKKEKEPEVKIKIEKVREPSPEARKTRHGPPKRDPTPPKVRSTRNSVGSIEDNAKLGSLKGPSKSSSSSAKSSPPTPRSILKKELKELKMPVEDEPPRIKRLREKETAMEKKSELPTKKVKIAVQPAKQSPPKPKPKSKRAASPPPAPKPKRATSPPPTASKPKRATSPPPPASKPKRATSPPLPAPKSKRAPSPPPALYPCSICGINHKTIQGQTNHMRIHVVTFTNAKLACDPCGEWFSTSEEYNTHHRKHKTKPYYCRHCYDSFKSLTDYDKHFEIDNCLPFIEIPDQKCEECWRTFPTQNLLDQHRCQGSDGRPGGKCYKCNRMYTLLKNLKKHESTCTYRKKGQAIIDPEVEKQLKHTQIRLTRCDELLTKIKGERIDISDVDNDFGFDSSCIYPYRYRIKSEPTTGYDTMVTIGDEIKQEYYAKNYVHWDSDDSDTERQVNSLTTLTLKTIFSNKLLGKVPRKRRRIKSENDNTDFDMSRDIDSIIDNLGKDDGFKDSANDSDCSESIFGPFNNKNDVANDCTFDSLLGSQEVNFDSLNNERVGENNESQDSQSLISSMEISALNNDKVSDLSEILGTKDTAVNEDDIDVSSKVVTGDEGINESSIKDDVQNTDLSKSEINETSQENESSDNEQSRFTETSVENSVSGNLNGVTESSDLELNAGESNVKVNGQADNYSLDKVNDTNVNDTINDKNESVEYNDRLSQENLSDDYKNDDISKNNDKNEGFTVNNGDVNDFKGDNDKITLDDIVPKASNLKGMDLDSISDEEFNFDA